ncbi:nucleoside phosphorylase [Streptomyces solincola]|uniref:Nucleoside phosphorylase n=2 Tax=Streptomyces solincola TaxID=2100817 RepID=A0A2S9Q2H1_9ACTN|nr:nucleoside phosphorylase [Streptomyces solincola]
MMVRGVCAAGLVMALLGLSGSGVVGGGETDRPDPAPVGIVSALPVEQAAVLAEMAVERHTDVQGFRFYVGSIAGRAVVSVASGELDGAAQLATWLLNTTFRPRATIFSGTAGAQNAGINVGDVVLSGFVVDKDAVRYGRDGRQKPYPAAEIHVTGRTNIAGALISGRGEQYPTPSDAAEFGSRPHPVDPDRVYIQGFAAAKQLVRTGAATPALGSVRLSEATGRQDASGAVDSKVIVGTVGQAPVWTESLAWVEAQNMLYQTDAEDNEGTGFAYANAVTGVPWMLVRGVSDTPWHPTAYAADLASKRAAKVCAHVVAGLPAEVDRSPVARADLSPLANARQAGYLIADRVAYGVGPVTEVTYTDPQGRRSLTGGQLADLRRQYTPGAGGLG